MVHDALLHLFPFHFCVFEISPSEAFVKMQHCIYIWLVFRQTLKNGATQGKVAIVSNGTININSDLVMCLHIFVHSLMFLVPDSVLGTGDKLEGSPYFYEAYNHQVQGRRSVDR